MPANSYQSPSGTRDFYPQDLLRRRYIEKLWRDTSIRHAFEEIDGPTFEHTDLYAVKSGEGILSEIFQVFSGKDEGQVKAAGEGRAPYALRPEFTPTLARLYAAKAGSLPKPTRWFWQQNCFRAERQQRGRLREFMQWNCDIVGDASTDADVDATAACVGLMQASGLTPRDVRVKANHRAVLGKIVTALGVDAENASSAFVLLDRRDKLDDADLEAMAFEFGISNIEFLRFLKRPRRASDIASALESLSPEARDNASTLFAPLRLTEQQLASAGVGEWCDINLNIARGLAYYTGMVFEVHEASGSERAIAGGGRYDNLIELFGGPPTPAVGFGMGDVVLSLVLQDRGLMPEGEALLDALSAPTASYRPEAFVLSAGATPQDQEAAAAQVRPLVARLRRGTESSAWLSRESRKPWDHDRYWPAAGGARPMHARLSSKSTKNIGKLIGDANASKAKFAVIIESGDEATIQDLRPGSSDKVRVKLQSVPHELIQRLDR